jgi:F-type H+-transporting ATPase subunit alpha
MEENFFLRELERSFDEDLLQLKNDICGFVVSYLDGICFVNGLKDAFIYEVIIFDNGSKGVVFSETSEICYVFIFSNKNIPKVGEGARRTKKCFSVSVGGHLLGRIIDVEGNFIDGHKDVGLENEDNGRSVETDILGVVDRKAVTEPFFTGFLKIDALIPIGRGQRQLFLGNRSSGKTATLVDIMVNQRDKNLICVYVAIAQKQSDIAQIVNYISSFEDAMKNCIFVVSDSSRMPVQHFLAPYVGVTIAEYFSREKRDVAIIYDDLTNHAIAYREMSLLVKNSPAREAYPGDIFYLHSRLLERAGNFLNYGSITALPVAQLQEDDITAYIPTNLISITDGQVFFDMKLFNNGIFPAINTELSVSRVSGAQVKMIKDLSRSLRLDLAEYHEMAVFAQFGVELDENTRKKMLRGNLLMSILCQQLGEVYSKADEILILFLFKFFDEKIIEIKKVDLLIRWIIDFLKKTRCELYESLNLEDKIDDIKYKELFSFMENAISIFRE